MLGHLIGLAPGGETPIKATNALPQSQGTIYFTICRLSITAKRAPLVPIGHTLSTANQEYQKRFRTSDWGPTMFD